eukprot:TRINITY_DN37562_c0_g1_i1.p1 TRINITY_DN37562_c0_g1~~TRINITY_DN37562_c0_g1_i1.p1  ORF type:complete len:898 (-),score=127.82 TRINITY_DN37562_c0_g1_i1:113-2527(-)
MAQDGGKTCKGPEHEIRACNVNSSTCKSEAPVDCVLGEWSFWTNCSRVCGGGQHSRSRSVKVVARNLGLPCHGGLAETEACNEDACSGALEQRDCLWDNWGDWSACTRTCGGGQRERHRIIVNDALGGGRPCKAASSIEIGPCGMNDCFQLTEVCGWGVWSDWKACTKTCGSGQQTRFRQKEWHRKDIGHAQRRLQSDWGSGPHCTGSQKGVRPCGLMPCESSDLPIPCRWSLWGDWASCTCEGLRTRARFVKQQPSHGGLACAGPMEESASCNPPFGCFPLNVDCDIGPWSAWSDCSKSCGGGQMYHSRSIIKHAEAWGSGCFGSLEGVASCNEQPCGQVSDCTYSSWTSWNACSKSCGGGQHKRSRSINSFAQHGGMNCQEADLEEVESCSTQPCNADKNFAKVNCEWSVWTSWTSCPATCGVGQVRRSRIVAVEASKGGRLCDGFFEEFRNCTLRTCPKHDCDFQEWSPWSSCSDRCGGYQERTRGFKTFAVGGGDACTGGTRQLKPCNEDKAGSFCISDASGSVDCKLSDWSQWSACSHECGGGQRSSSRQVLKQARGGGKPCEATLRKVEPCNMLYCPGDEPVDCQMGDWGSFAACTATCGGGEMRRNRQVEVEARNGGKPCLASDTTEVVPCNTHPCGGGEYCNWADWSSWSECSELCDGGQKKRHRMLVSSELLPSMTSSSSSSNEEDAALLGATTGLEEVKGSGPSLQAGEGNVHKVLSSRLQLSSFLAIGAVSVGYLAFLSVGRLNLAHWGEQVYRRLRRRSEVVQYSLLRTEDASNLGFSEDEESPFADHPLLS